MEMEEIAAKYPVLKNVIDTIKKKDKFETLFPPQADAINTGYLDGKNLVLAIPTCGGKTIIAELAMLKTIFQTGRKAIYLVPMKALAMEKHREFKEKYEPLGVRVAVSIGDYDRADTWLSNYDIIVTSNEKCDSLLRHNSPWFRDVGIIVADEIHLIDDAGRGPTLEIVLTKLMELSKAQILALSATIKNSNEIADWLDAELVKSEYRPTKLYEGVCCQGVVDFPNDRKNNFVLKGSFEESVLLSEYALKKGKQSLVFVSTRKGTQAEAERIGNKIGKHLKPEELNRLSELANNVEKALEHPTTQCRRLAGVIRKGAAFHNSGLAHKQKAMIEDSFRSGLLKSIAATSTLAYGVNLPSDYCIMRDVRRYYSIKGYDFIPVLEYKQCAGRAGRIKYSSEGRTIIVAKTKSEYETLKERFILGETENITSKLGVEPVLRTHVLALIASGATSTKKELMDFFFKTFYAHQYKDLSKIEGILNKVIGMLKDFEFIEGDNSTADMQQQDKQKQQPDHEVVFKKATSLLQKEKETLRPTRIGRRVAELYLDPITAHKIISSLKEAHGKAAKMRAFPIIHLATNTMEMRPLMNMRKPDYEEIENLLTAEEKSLLETPPSPWDIGYDDFLRSIKTAHVLNQWAEEHGEDQLLEKYGATPGEMHARLNNIDWLLYSMQELVLLLGHKEQQTPIRKVRIRIKYGVKEELLPLVRIKGIGRARARKLWNSNVRTLKALRDIPLKSLAGIVGATTAENIKNQLGEMDEKAQDRDLEGW